MVSSIVCTSIDYTSVNGISAQTQYPSDDSPNATFFMACSIGCSINTASVESNYVESASLPSMTVEFTSVNLTSAAASFIKASNVNTSCIEGTSVKDNDYSSLNKNNPVLDPSADTSTQTV
jgi:hypothetical protein